MTSTNDGEGDALREVPRIAPMSPVRAHPYSAGLSQVKPENQTKASAVPDEMLHHHKCVILYSLRKFFCVQMNANYNSVKCL